MWEFSNMQDYEINLPNREKKLITVPSCGKQIMIKNKPG